MTNEKLDRRYYGGDERALEELYRRNLGLIRRIARETAREFNCLHMDRERPGELSGYTKTILEDLCGEGALEFLTRVQSREYDETVCLLSKLNVKHHIEVEITMDELDLTAAESKATYDEIKAYVLEKFGFKVSQLYIAQIKRKCGIIERKNYNQSKKEDAKVPKCPPEKEAAIMDALKHFQMIP